LASTTRLMEELHFHTTYKGLFIGNLLYQYTTN